MSKLNGLLFAMALLLSACSFSSYTTVVPDPGAVRFGSSVTNRAAVINPTSSARLDQVVGIGAHLSRQVTGPVTVQVLLGDTAVLDQAAYTFSSPGEALAVNFGLNILPGPGRYTFNYAQGSEVLATGQLDVLAAAPGSSSS